MKREYKEFWLRQLDNLYHWTGNILPLRWACDRYDEYLIGDSDSWDQRCPVCEGIQYPGLSHNRSAEYCTEYHPWLPTPHEVKQMRSDLDVALRDWKRYGR